MGFFLRLLLGLTCALFGAMMILVAPTLEKAIFVYGFGAFCFAITLVCFTRGRVAQFFGSIIGSAVFCVGLWYLGTEIARGQAVSGSRAAPSILNAFMFMFVFGIPAATYVFGARFGLGSDASSRFFEASTEEQEAAEKYPDSPDPDGK